MWKLNLGKRNAFQRKNTLKTRKQPWHLVSALKRFSLSLTFPLPPFCNFIHTVVQITPLLTSSATENYFENFVLWTPLHSSCKQTLALQGTFGFIERIFKDSPRLTLLPLKSAGVLPISVAGNLNLWQALLKSTIHLNISNNLTNSQLQRCEALQPSTPIIPQAGKSKLELTVQGHCNSVTDLQTVPKARQLFSTLSSSCPDFQLLIQSLVL